MRRENNRVQRESERFKEKRTGSIDRAKKESFKFRKSTLEDQLNQFMIPDLRDYGRMSELELARKIGDPMVDQMVEAYKQQKEMTDGATTALKTEAKKWHDDYLLNINNVYDSACQKNNKTNGGNGDMEPKTIFDIMADAEGDMDMNVEILDSGACRANVIGEKLNEKYGGMLDVRYDKATGEILYMAVVPNGKIIASDLEEIETIGQLDTNSFGDCDILESKSINIQDQMDEYDDQEEAIQEKFDQLTEECGVNKVFAIECRLSVIDGDCETLTLKDMENCRIVDFNIFNGSLVLNIGLDPIDFKIDKCMDSFMDTIVTFSGTELDENEKVVEGDAFEMTIANILNSGLGLWCDYSKELYMSPLEYRGLTKLFI